MRIIGGSAKGRRLKTVPCGKTRPILSRVRRSLFDILRDEIQGARFLDLFGGSGAVGIEALSRGASYATFIDTSKIAVETIRENLKVMGFEDRAKVLLADAFRFLKSCKEAYDIVYVAPPQFQGLWDEVLLKIAERPHLLTENGRVIAQIHPKEYASYYTNTLKEYDSRRYGNTMLVFYKKEGNQ